MNRFEQVKQILDDSVGGAAFPAHGAFWRGQTRDQFVDHVEFGQRLLIVGNGEESNLVKALRGNAPFGSDVGTPGAFFRRMPAGRPPIPEDQINVIREWIDDGCPATDENESTLTVDADAGGPMDSELHNAFWRDFDNWALFQASPEVRAAVNTFFRSATTWMEFARDPSGESAWQSAINNPEFTDAVRLLATRQMATVSEHYGNPVPLLTLLDSFERFGDDSLPDDPLRPEDQRHNMNGPIMWFFWCAFTDACLRLQIANDYWSGHARALLLGMMNDGLFRERFPVAGFTADDSGKRAMRDHVRNLAADNLQGEMRRRFADTPFG